MTSPHDTAQKSAISQTHPYVARAQLLKELTHPACLAILDLSMACRSRMAYLLVDPELSLKSIPVLNGVMGNNKTAINFSLVAVMATLAGDLFGVVMAALEFFDPRRPFDGQHTKS